MNTLKLDLQDYRIGISTNLDTIKFVCKEILQEHGMEGFEERTYDLPIKNIVDIEVDMVPMKYIRIYYDDNTYIQVKLESSHEIVLDYFDQRGNELLSEYGAWDFYDSPE